MQPKLKFKTKEEVLGEYEKTADEYDADRSGSFEGKLMDELQRKLIHKIIKRNDSRKILEAGCGTGRILMYLALNDFECYGIDPSNNMLSKFKQKLKNLNIRVNLKEGDIENIKFDSNTFDCTYTMHVLMHLPDYKKAFREMYRVTKKGGIVICDFPNKNSPWTKLSLLTSPNAERTRLFSIEELEEFFKPYKHRTIGLFSYARTFYKIPVLRSLFALLERFLPLPLLFRRHLFVVVQKQ